MNFIAIMTWNGRPVPGEVDFFETREAGLAHCTAQNALASKEVRWIIRQLKEVF